MLVVLKDIQDLIKSKVIMRQPIVKDFDTETKVEADDLMSKDKDFIKCPQGALRPKPCPRGLHH